MVYGKNVWLYGWYTSCTLEMIKIFILLFGGRHSTVVSFSLRTQPSRGLNLAAGKIEQRGKKRVFPRTCRPKIIQCQHTHIEIKNKLSCDAWGENKLEWKLSGEENLELNLGQRKLARKSEDAIKSRSKCSVGMQGHKKYFKTVWWKQKLTQDNLQVPLLLNVLRMNCRWQKRPRHRVSVWLGHEFLR